MNIAIITTRISGTDGVSLEVTHWKKMLESIGHRVTLISGKLDREGILIPELNFQWPKVVELHDRIVYGKEDYYQVESDIFTMAERIEGKLREAFNNGRKINLLIVPNVLSLPMHFPLAVALTRVIEELEIPTIARHHDFWWERVRFLNSSMFPFFECYFPPKLPNIRHVVINSIAQEELKKRTGINADVICDSFDFNKTINKLDSCSRNFRSDFGIRKDDIVFLQPTRIIPRKRIEISIDLIQKLKNPKAILVISGYGGDEAGDYERKLKRLVKINKVRAIFIGKYINSHRRIVNSINGNGLEKRRIYTLWDCYVNSDFVTYPTEIEGFGNQFVETTFFKKPILVTPYKVFEKDIAPLGFQVISAPDKITNEVVNNVKDLISDKEKIDKMVETNYQLGEKYFSYESTLKKIKKIMEEL